MTRRGEEGSDEAIDPSAILGALLSDTRSIVARLLAEPLRDRAELDAALKEAVELSTSEAFPMADQPSSQAIALRCTTWLARWPELGSRARKLVQVGIDYYVLRDDGEDDLKSPFGYDDDIEVINAVAQALGEPPLKLP